MGKKENHPIIHCASGAAAGFAESCALHPLDTIKTRLQLVRSNKPAGVLATARRIVATEGVKALYKGLGPVVSGITPKVALRFTVFGFLKSKLEDDAGKMTLGKNLMAGLGAGLTEAVMVVTPVELVKIRLQAQESTPGATIKYRGQLHGIGVIVREEGIGALYKGLGPTMFRQGSNQAMKFAAYNQIKNIMSGGDPDATLHPLKHLFAGVCAGSIGGVLNCPVDVVKTRIQQQQTARYKGTIHAFRMIIKEEGPRALFKGVVPRVMRLAPGHGIMFMVYEKVSSFLLDMYVHE